MNNENPASSPDPKIQLDCFYTLNLNTIRNSTSNFVSNFPGNTLYAVKANPLPDVIREISAAGVSGFDVASTTEAALASEIANSKPCYFMNPAKSRASIEYAHFKLGITSYVVDCEEELIKLLTILPLSKKISIFFRLVITNKNAVFELNSKFGMNSTELVRVAQIAASRSQWKLGIAFHVGSQVTTKESFIGALKEADYLLRHSEVDFFAVDIGGGFPGEYSNNSEINTYDLLKIVKNEVLKLDRLSSVQLFCEPGRALVFDSMSLFSRVNLRKKMSLYLSSGIYSGLLSSEKWIKFPVSAWRDGIEISEFNEEFEIYGPTCDSRDKLGFKYSLPSTIQDGDWVEFKCVGAYSVTLNTEFNGFGTSQIFKIKNRNDIGSIFKKIEN